jgi:acetoin utilization deacetylase AcuC-like enzyme
MTCAVLCAALDFLPNTGDIKLQDVGHGPGKYYSLNVPLKKGLSDEAFAQIYRPVCHVSSTYCGLYFWIVFLVRNS